MLIGMRSGRNASRYLKAVRRCLGTPSSGRTRRGRCRGYASDLGAGPAQGRSRSTHPRSRGSGSRSRRARPRKFVAAFRSLAAVEWRRCRKECGPGTPRRNASRVGVGSELTDTGAELDVHVGVTIEARACVVEILGAVSDVERDKLGSRVALEDAIACFGDSFFSREEIV